MEENIQDKGIFDGSREGGVFKVVLPERGPNDILWGRKGLLGGLWVGRNLTD